MQKNVTLSLDETVLIKAKHIAVEQRKSLSQWVADLIKNTVSRESDFEKARKRALKRLKHPFDLGGKRFTREELHER